MDTYNHVTKEIDILLEVIRDQEVTMVDVKRVMREQQELKNILNNICGINLHFPK